MNRPISFDDGAAYEEYMGKWSHLAGSAFLDWLTPAPGLRWLDVGCGNGAFTETIVQRCAPATVTGVDPSAAQLEFARTRPALRNAELLQGDAMALPLRDQSVDITVMPLVIFFVPEPARGVAEMARVLRPGGIATAYSWDMEGGGFPYALLQAELLELGAPAKVEPRRDASRLDVSHELWKDAGFDAIQTQQFTVQRTYRDLDHYWNVIQGGPSVRHALASLNPTATARLKERLRIRLPQDDSGCIVCTARANAIQGRVRS
ncbi:MAG TPA: class I SAM-dependent methyltransferase [Steroidobacteraceae bacterium]|nr:class I SAM-dependent methyltransferase [Steroidobacteraceae bacterium]